MDRVGHWLRKRWLAFLLVLGVLVVGISLFDLPYATGGPAGRTVVKATGGQFFWSLQPDHVAASTPVRFDVTSIDVDHSFGIYDPRADLIVGSGNAGVRQRARSYVERDGHLPDPLPRALRCKPLDHAEHIHGDTALMAMATTAPGSAALHPRASSFTTEASSLERRIGFLFAVSGIALIALMGIVGLLTSHASHRDRPFARLVLRL